ncbi:hypothetical protein AB0C65_35605 [Nocardia sp. NPDC048505]|uniref:hypothetical protein n=1 Tax=Nocardia sp. NPDC048505 TaxID=3155756 RepID=UPI0033C9AC34
MLLPRTWIGVDVVATRTRGDLASGKIILHTAMGTRQNRLLNRWADRLNEAALESSGGPAIDDEGRALLIGLITDQLRPVFAQLDQGADPRELDLADQSATHGSLEWRAHWVTAPDGYPLGLVVWLAPAPVPDRLLYNSWVLDLEAMTTSSAGDDISIVGSDRQFGEPRAIRDLLRFANAADVPKFLALYWDADSAPKATPTEAIWSIRTPDSDSWVHFLSTAHAGIGPTARSVYGMSAQLPVRPEGLDLTLRQLTQFGGTSLLLMDAERHIVLQVAGALRDELHADQIAELVDQTQLADWFKGPPAAARDGTWFEGKVIIGGRRYYATAWPLPTVQNKPMRPVAIAIQPLGDFTGAQDESGRISG